MWFGPMFSSMRLTYINWPIFRYRWVLQLNYLWPWFHLHQHTWSSHLCMWNGLPTNWTSRRTQRDQRLYWYLNACFSDERCFLASWSRGRAASSTVYNRCQVSDTKWFALLFHLCILLLADVDECFEDATVCGPDANCTNSIGSYSCTCFPGFRLNDPDVIASVSNPCTGVWTCSLLVWVLIWPSYILLLCD